MFSVLDRPKGRLRTWSVRGISIGLHLGVLLVLMVAHRDAVKLTPNWIAYGSGSRTYRVIYAPPGGEEMAPTKVQKFSAPSPLPLQRYKNKTHRVDLISSETEISDKTRHAGTPLGTTITGMVEGHEVRLAFPQVFPDPPIARSELPAGLQGDIIIEVTIDAHGEVVDARILQSIGHGLDEKVLATLRGWKFTPATLDGVPVASKHDVHFHFPS